MATSPHKWRVFLSGTRNDLGSFYPAARERLQLTFPEAEVSAMEGAEPEDVPGDHWSHREATKPHVLIGLVGRNYGTPLHGHDRSLTEEEFDVAGRVGVDRLMFLTVAGDPTVIAGQTVDQRTG